MAVQEYTIKKSDWDVSAGNWSDGRPYELYKAQSIVLNVVAGTLWIPKRLRVWNDDDELEVNDVELGTMTHRGGSGEPRWTKIPQDKIALIISPLPSDSDDIPNGDDEEEVEPKQEEQEQPSQQDTQSPVNISVIESKWLNHDIWHGQLEFTGSDERVIKILQNRSDTTNKWRSWAVHGKRRRSNEPVRHIHAVKCIASVDSVDLQIKIQHQGKSYGPFDVTVEQPREEDRPTRRDRWESRAVRKDPESRQADFDTSRLNKWAYEFEGNQDVHYTGGAVPQNVLTSPAPGGFSVMWEWDKSDENWKDIEFVRVWYRPTLWRGSGAPWISSANKNHMQTGENTVVSIPVLPSYCGEGELVDVVLQGSDRVWRKPYEHTDVQVVEVGPEIKQPDNGRVQVSMLGFVWRRFSALNPMLSDEEYADLKAPDSDEGSDDEEDSGATNVDPRFNVSAAQVAALKMDVVRNAVVLSTDEMRAICRRALPGFQFVTDNCGNFNALTDEMWNRVIDITTTDMLIYDPTWFSCADFSTDFKSAAARLGAKVLVLWDFAAGHAYCALPTVQADGSIELDFFEPQNDMEVEIDPTKGLYQQDGAGLIFAW